MGHRNIPVFYLIALASMLFSTLICAQTIVAVYPLPNNLYFNSAYGLTTDSSHLYLSSGSTSSSFAGYIYKFDLDGNVVDSIATGLGSSQGLAWDGSHFWYFFRGTSTTSAFVKLTPNGSQVSQILSGTTYVGGLHWHQGGLWHALYYPNNDAALYKLDVTSGTVIDTINTIGGQPQGIATDDQYFYYAMDDNDGDPENIYIYDPLLDDTVGVIPIADPISTRPRGLAFDGQHLWLVADPVGTVQRALFKIDLGGSGTPNINLSTSDLNFGLTPLGQSDSLLLSVQNTGNAPLSIDSITIDNSVFGSDLTTFPSVIQPNEMLTFAVTYTPATVTPSVGTMLIHNSDPAEPQAVVTLRGEGVNVNATIGLLATNHAYGNVWIPDDGVAFWDLGIYNSGIENLVLDSTVLGNPAFTSAMSTPATILPDDTVMMRLYFSPTEEITYQDTLRIYSNDPLTPVAMVTLSGTGMGGPFNAGYRFWNFQVPDNPVTSFQEYEVDGLQPINDITGDGVPEVVIATENYWLMCINGAASGIGEPLWVFTSYISNSSAGSIGGTNDFGVQDAIDIASDLNGDGYNDVVIATGGGNEHVYAIDGTDGTIIWEFGTNDPTMFGLGDFEACDAQRDFNGDGVVDVLAIAGGNTQGTGYHSAYLFDGTDGTLIWDYIYPGPAQTFGKTIISIDDINFDGLPDVAIAVGNNGAAQEKVYCMDGQTGNPIWDFDVIAYEPKEMLELPVSGESPDIIVAEYFNRVHRLDGETGVAVWTHQLGGSLAGVIQIDLIKDVNNDGVDDVLVAAFTNGAVCISGADGTQLWQYPMYYQYGITNVPDLNGDGIEEVFVGTGNSSPFIGEVYLITGQGDSLFFTETFSSNKVISVNVLPSIDRNGSVELLAGTREGQVICYSGGDIPLTGIDDRPLTATRFALFQNYPNPFNPTTTIRYSLKDNGDVKLSIYNMLGQKVRTLVSGYQTAGYREVSWDGRNDQGVQAATGIYVYKLEAGELVSTKKMILLK